MLLFLAESKTMSGTQMGVDPKYYHEHCPVFEKMADTLMERIESLTIGDLSQILGISNQLAIKAHSLAYDFPHKLTGYKALDGFIGEAYRGLDVKTMSTESISRANDTLRIISSVYGLLRPNDIIKPYRCEFNKPIGVDNVTPIKLFKSKITIELVNHIKSNKINEIIDLLPGDADKCIDWKIVRAFASVQKICFQSISPEGKLKTPIAKRLKELRGIMARTILMEGISTFKDLTTFKSEHFIYSEHDSKPGLPILIAE